MDVHELTFDNLYLSVKRAMELNAKYFAIIIDLGNGNNEIIINNLKTIVDEKLEYWKSAYDNNLRLKRNPNIRISGIIYCDDFREIGDFFNR